MRKLESYRFRDGVTPLDGIELNARFFDIDLRLHNIELLRISWEDAVREINAASLSRIDSVFMPLLEELRSNTAAEIQALQESVNSAVDQVNIVLQTLEGGLVDVSRLREGSGAITYADGIVTKVTYTVPTGTFEENYTYNDDGSIHTIAAKLNGDTVFTRTYAYSEDGNLAGWTEG